jgi:hypothetical protein
MRSFVIKSERSAWLLMASGLSLGFLGGSKTSGLIFCAILFCLTLFVLRRHVNAFKWFVASFAVSTILFGSVETYLLSDLRYGKPLIRPTPSGGSDSDHGRSENRKAKFVT